ncbi:calcium/calmodulin dependent protein kinase [Phlyctema vagabunda]|uniref:Calcium/calmodulin dependent protein kinase n=1 Tax=Phlyctema vagabunda TaxID=108571 RepID=A0ABR4PAT6_9HELO
MVHHLPNLVASSRRSAIVRLASSTTLILENRHPQRHLSPLRRAISSQASKTADQPFRPGATLRGQSGRIYSIQEILAEGRKPLLCVYRASAEGQDFIIKNMIPGEYEYQQDLQKPLAPCPNLRTVVDGLPGPELFIYPFLETDFLQFSQKKLSNTTRRDMLRSALVGIAALHDKNIIHTDIKPNSILLDYEKSNDMFSIKRVQISDLEDAVILPPGKYLREALCGNQMWRSPESWARAAQVTPSDMFSFGIVSIYVMLNDMVLRASDDELAADDSWRYVLRRHISFFGEEEGFKGLLQWIGESNPFFERLVVLAGSFNSANPRKPFEKWYFVDAQFRDLVCRMTTLDPAKRITAREALQHPWFAQVD